jgi:hypothetical protein
MTKHGTLSSLAFFEAYMQEIVNHHCFWAYGLGAVNRVLQNRVNPLPASRIRLRGRDPRIGRR